MLECTLLTDWATSSIYVLYFSGSHTICIVLDLNYILYHMVADEENVTYYYYYIYHYCLYGLLDISSRPYKHL